MAPLVPLPQTGDRLADVVVATLGPDGLGAGGAWTVGTWGAIAEMTYAGDRADLRREGRTIEVRTARGGLRFELDDDVRAFTDPDGGPRAPVLLGVPRRRLPPACSMVTVIGADRGALRSGERDEVLVDLGLGHGAASFAVRTGDADLLSLLRSVAGRPWSEVPDHLRELVVAASPTRVVRSAAVRVEVHCPIPAPDERSPDGPHTHLLPRQLRLGRELPVGVVLPAGYAPAGTYHPPRPRQSAPAT